MNLVMHTHTKYIELDYHFIRKRAAAKSLQISFVSSKDQIVDILTKPLLTNRFMQLRSSLSLTSVPLEWRGDVKAASRLGI